MKHLLVTLLSNLCLLFTLISCRHIKEYDLAIINVKVFDSIDKTVSEAQTILINADTIAAIVTADEKFSSKSTIDGKGKLITPGIINTHIHLTDIFGDYEAAPEYIHKDSIFQYRKKITETYLPQGITTIKECGCPEKWLVETINWQQNPTSDFPNFYTTGGALISNEERTPYISHVEVTSPDDALKKVDQYHNGGLNYLKLYTRLRMPEMKACMKRAKELNMNVCAHLEWRITIDTALVYGVRHFEHAYTLAPNVLASDVLMEQFNSEFDEYFQKPSYFPRMLDQFNFIAKRKELRKKLSDLINFMAVNKATLSTTTHLFASQVGRSYFLTSHDGEVSENFTSLQTKRMNDGFDLMMNALKEAHNKGVKICIGTDCIDGGKAVLSEMLLFYEAGFSIEDILQIATYNGAHSMDLTDRYGSIEVGKKADLIIFEENPFENYKYFLSKKVVIKDGKIFGS